MNTIECPYCNNEQETEMDGCTEYEEECHSCEETFYVEVEFEPSFSTSTIEIHKCPICECEVLSYEMSSSYPKAEVHRYLSDEEYKKVCRSCYYKGWHDEYIKEEN